MSKSILTAVAALLVVLGFSHHRAYAQGGGPPTRSELQKDVFDLSTLDPDIEKYLPRWRIQEADLKIKLATYFRLTDIPVAESDSMIVTASFPDPNTGAQDLLSIRVGDSPAAVLSGSQKIRSALGEALYQQILSRDYAHDVIPPATPITENAKERMPTVFQPVTAKQYISVSAFGQIAQLGTTGARFEHHLGDDEIGYHFWLSGQGKVTVHYPIIPLSDAGLRAKGVPDILMIDLGVGYRMKFGTNDQGILGGIISPRKLNGTIGPKAIAKVEYRLPQVNDLGFALDAEVPFNKLKDVEDVNSTDGSVAWFSQIDERVKRLTGAPEDTIRAAYFLRTVAQGYAFWENWLDSYEHFFRISLGLSYQEIQRTAITNGLGTPIAASNNTAIGSGVQSRQLIHPTEFEDWLYARIDYLNQSGYPFGLSVQIANRNLLLSAYVPVIRNWLFLEAKYTSPVLRDSPAPWEYQSFFMISPVLRFEID